MIPSRLRISRKRKARVFSTHLDIFRYLHTVLFSREALIIILNLKISKCADHIERFASEGFTTARIYRGTVRAGSLSRPVPNRIFGRYARTYSWYFSRICKAPDSTASLGIVLPREGWYLPLPRNLKLSDCASRIDLFGSESFFL